MSTTLPSRTVKTNAARGFPPGAQTAPTSPSMSATRAAPARPENVLAALVLWISTTNLYNRINVATRQVAGSWK